MESLPFTDYSATAKDSTALVPLAAISPSGVHIDIVKWDL